MEHQDHKVLLWTTKNVDVIACLDDGLFLIVHETEELSIVTVLLILENVNLSVLREVFQMQLVIVLVLKAIAGVNQSVHQSVVFGRQ
jgi:hypothetical protein